jgi:hypothetical protein
VSVSFIGYRSHLRRKCGKNPSPPKKEKDFASRNQRLSGKNTFLYSQYAGSDSSRHSINN